MTALLREVDIERDRVLVARYQAGDTKAFDEVYDRYFPLIRARCLRLVRDHHAAEELAQEVFVRALRALPRLGGEQRLYPWLSVIAKNLCTDHHRRSQRCRPLPEIEVAVEDTTGDGLDVAVDVANLQVALDRVKARHREVLQLREFEELSYEAIAQRLDVGIGTVQSLLHRARIALRREYLGVTGTLGGLPSLGVLPLLRRLRDRLAAVQGRLPDPSGALAAPLAVAAITAVTALGLLPDVEPRIVELERAPLALVATLPAPGPSGPPAQEPPTRTSSPPEAAPDAAVPQVVTPQPVARPPAPAPPAPPPAPAVDVAPVQVYLGPEGAARAQERSEEMPVSAQVREVFAGADPVAPAASVVRTAVDNVTSVLEGDR